MSILDQVDFKELMEQVNSSQLLVMLEAERAKNKELQSFIVKISNTVDRYFYGCTKSNDVLHELDTLLSKHPIRKERSDVSNNTRKV